MHVDIVDDPRWRRVHVPVLDGGAEHDVSVIVPFRPFHLDKLGSDAITLAITDPLHVTFLAMIELLDTAATNINDFEGSIAKTGRLARFYDAVVQDKLRHASKQEFRHPHRRTPVYEDIHDAPVAIAEVAGATTLIEAFSLQAVAAYIQTLIAIDDASTDSVRLELAGVASVFQSVVVVKNRELMEDCGKVGKFHVTPALRLIPPDIPKLILIHKNGRKAEVLPLKM